MEVSMLIKAFLVGGGICAIGQLLIDYTKLTPASILVSFVGMVWCADRRLERKRRRNHSSNRSRPDSRSAVSFRRKVRRAWKIKKLCTGRYRPVWSFLRLSVYYLPSA